MWNTFFVLGYMYCSDHTLLYLVSFPDREGSGNEIRLDNKLRMDNGSVRRDVSPFFIGLGLEG